MSTGKLNSNSLSSKKNIRFEHELIEDIESCKDSLIPFSAWVKQACREKLEREKAPVSTPISEHTQVRTNKPKPRYTWITPQGEFSGRNAAVKASGVKADSLTKLCDSEEDNGYNRILWK